MTRIDILLVFAGIIDVTDRLWKRVRPAFDLAVDAARWTVREHVRRSGRQSGSHRKGISVWEILHNRPEEEQEFVWKSPGQHRDTRGWRYRSPVWSLIERTSDHRNWEIYWRITVRNLMEDIQYMLSNPPQVMTLHGCKDCTCVDSRVAV